MLSLPFALAALLLQDAPESPTTQAAPTACEVLDALEPTARGMVADGLAPGMVIGVLHGGERCVRGIGTLAPDSDFVPDARTVYEIGSVSKVFTGVLLADAVLREVVTVDTPVQEVWPDAFELDVHEDQPIRLRHLTTHTSGLPRMPGNFRPADPLNPYADYGTELLFAFLDEVRVRRAPGERYAYSNLAVGLLGEALAQVQETDYATLLQQRIAGPLEMGDTALVLTDSMRARFAPAYDVDGAAQHSWDFNVLAPAGGIRSTMHDMLLFADACLHPADGPLADALPLSMLPLSEPSKGPAVAYGWHLASEGATRWHNGQTGGYHSFLAVRPDDGSAIVILSNTTTGLIDLLGQNGMRVMSGEELREIDYPRAIAMDADALAEYVGRYRLGILSSMRLTLVGGVLRAQLTGQPAVRVYPSAKDRFFYRAVDATLSFQRDEAGAITGLTLRQNGRDMPAKRVEPKGEGEDE